MSIVYMPQEIMYRNDRGMLVPKFNTYLAENYGELKTILSHGNVMVAPQPMVRKIRQVLKNFSDDDYILPTGDPVAIGAVMCIAAEINHGRVRILKWDRHHKDYIVLNMNLKGNIADNQEEHY